MKYSAGMVSCLFWLSEARKTAQYLINSFSKQEIIDMAIKENIYQVRAEDRAKRIVRLSLKRLETLSPELMKHFIACDISTAKVILLLTIMKTDLLFYEFIHSVYRQAIILGTKKLQDSDINIFFDDKISKSDIVAKWSESAIKKLKQTYTKILWEAGVIDSATGTRNIIVPLVDYKTIDMINEAGLAPYLDALIGEN